MRCTTEASASSLPCADSLQYEELISEEGEAKELRRVKDFLGVDPEEPAGKKLGIANSRKFRIQPEGHPMRREQYEALIKLVRPDCQETGDMLVQAGLIEDLDVFLERWEQVWEDNLNSCDDGGNCKIQLS